MEVGILLGTMVVNRSKIHSYLVKPHHVSIGGVEDPIYGVSALECPLWRGYVIRNP